MSSAIWTHHTVNTLTNLFDLELQTFVFQAQRNKINWQPAEANRKIDLQSELYVCECVAFGNKINRLNKTPSNCIWIDVSRCRQPFDSKMANIFPHCIHRSSHRKSEPEKKLNKNRKARTEKVFSGFRRYTKRAKKIPEETFWRETTRFHFKTFSVNFLCRTVLAMFLRSFCRFAN